MVLDKWAWPRRIVVFTATSDLQNPVHVSIWRAVCTKNNVDVVKLILGRVVHGRGLVGVTYVGVAYSKWIVVVLLCSCLLVTGHPSVSVRVTVSKSLCLCLCVTECGMWVTVECPRLTAHAQNFKVIVHSNFGLRWSRFSNYSCGIKTLSKTGNFSTIRFHYAWSFC